MVIIHVAPFEPGVEVIIGGPFFVRLAKDVFGLGGNQLILPGSPAQTVLPAGGEKDVDAAGIILEDIVSAPPYNDAGALRRNRTDGIRLYDKELIRQGETVVASGVIGGGGGAEHRQGV